LADLAEKANWEWRNEGKGGDVNVVERAAAAKGTKILSISSRGKKKRDSNKKEEEI